MVKPVSLLAVLMGALLMVAACGVLGNDQNGKVFSDSEIAALRARLHIREDEFTVHNEKAERLTVQAPPGWKPADIAPPNFTPTPRASFPLINVAVAVGALIIIVLLLYFVIRTHNRRYTRAPPSISNDVLDNSTPRCVADLCERNRRKGKEKVVEDLSQPNSQPPTDTIDAPNDGAPSDDQTVDATLPTATSEKEQDDSPTLLPAEAEHDSAVILDEDAESNALDSGHVLRASTASAAQHSLQETSTSGVLVRRNNTMALTEVRRGSLQPTRRDTSRSRGSSEYSNLTLQMRTIEMFERKISTDTEKIDLQRQDLHDRKVWRLYKIIACADFVIIVAFWMWVVVSKNAVVRPGLTMLGIAIGWYTGGTTSLIVLLPSLARGLMYIMAHVVCCLTFAAVIEVLRAVFSCCLRNRGQAAKPGMAMHYVYAGVSCAIALVVGILLGQGDPLNPLSTRYALEQWILECVGVEHVYWLESMPAF